MDVDTGESPEDQSDSEDERKPTSLFFIPKTFRKVEGSTIADFTPIKEDDACELWYITAPSTFNPQLLQKKKIRVDQFPCVVHSETNKNSNVPIEYALIAQSEEEASDSILNIFPITTSKGTKYSLGKPFTRKLKIVERLQPLETVEKTEAVLKKLGPEPTNIQPQGLRVRYHPPGCDSSVLPALVARSSNGIPHQLY